MNGRLGEQTTGNNNKISEYIRKEKQVNVEGTKHSVSKQRENHIPDCMTVFETEDIHMTDYLRPQDSLT